MKNLKDYIQKSEESYTTKNSYNNAVACQFALDLVGIKSKIKVDTDNENFVYCIIDHPYLLLSINYQEYKKKFNINLNYFSEYLGNDARKKCASLIIDEPKEIGVITAKKVNDWINYYSLLFAEYEKMTAKNKKTIDLFVMDVVSKLDNVKWSNSNLTGYVDKNGIEYKFEINKESGYIHQRIELHLYSIGSEVKENIETFLKLSDNGFKNKEV